MKVRMKKCSIEDVAALQEISEQTFRDTYGHINTEENMRKYIDRSLTLEAIEQQLQQKGTSFYFLYAEGELSGYLKVNEGQAQSDIQDDNSLEIERIYVRKEFQSNGLGRMLLEKAIQVAEERGKAYIWLGVLETNKKAIDFYKSNGFYQDGSHEFILGDLKEIDYIMKFALQP